MKNILAFLFLLAAFNQINAQCIVLGNCQTSVQACDHSTNNASLWNESYWFDLANNTQDLADAMVISNLMVRDTCPGASANLRYLLFLDLDKNGSWETVIKSWEPPAPGTVSFDNWNNPNYDGGAVRVLDERPVPTGDKYQFAIETTVIGDTTQAHLRWNTQNQPNTFVNTELPYATHKIRWLVDDNLGNNSVCEYPIVVNDCQTPTIVCLNGLTVNIMPTEQITLWAADFLQYTEDNTTPAGLIQMGIRKCGEGSGFPLNPDGTPMASVTFVCVELGTQCVELWARDAAGNADFCETYVIVQDNIFACGGGGNDNIPTVVCLNGLSVNMIATEQVELWAADFLLYATDDNTPVNLLEFGLRKCGTGSGFPEDGNGNPILNLTFDCSEMGTQCVELWIRDLDGNADYCETYALIQDNAGNCGGGNPGAPTIVCINGLTVNLMPSGEVELWGTDFLHYAQDDITPSNLLEFGIRKCGTASLFPEDGNGDPIEQVVFDCNELYVQCVELWARDEDGNADYCETYVIVQDNAGNCNQLAAQITTCVTNHCNASPVHGALISSNLFYLGAIGPLDPAGCARFPTASPQIGNVNITPVNTLFPLNGVTVFDLIKIKRFILGLDTDLSPYDIIAADANKSRSITGFDLIELRKLLLGTTGGFANNNSWRFVDANFVFPNPQNPFQTVFPEFANIPNAIQQGNYQISFKAIKVGDLDCDAWPGLHDPSLDRGLPQRSLSLPDATVLKGETIEISLQMPEAGQWAGLQMSLQFDPEKVEILEVHAGNLPGLDADAFYQPKPGVFNFVWASEQAQNLSSGQDLFRLRIRALESLKISETFKASNEFENLGSLGEAPQSLTLDFRQNDAPVLLQETTILVPQPNPTTAGAIIPIRLGQAEQVRVEMADISGKIVWFNTLNLNTGSHLMEIPAQAMPQAGVYVWRVQTGSKTASGKLVRI